MAIPKPPSQQGGRTTTSTTTPGRRTSNTASSWQPRTAGAASIFGSIRAGQAGLGVSGVAEWRAQYGAGGNPAVDAILDERVDYTRLPEGQEMFRPLPQMEEARRFGNSSTVKDLLDDITTWDEEEVSAMQTQLLRAGYYGNTKPDEIAFGTVDGATRSAWGGLLRDAVYKKSPITDLLRSSTATGEAEDPDVVQGRQAKIGGGGVQNVDLSDPAGIRSIADRIAQVLLGRDATDAEKARYAPMIQNAERSAQARIFDAQTASERKVFDLSVAASGPVGGTPEAQAAVDAQQVKYSGGMLHPLGSAAGRLNANFGQNRGTHRHGGVDISAPLGTPLIAVVPGVVVGKASGGDGNAAGNRIHIKGDDGRFYSYFHMDNGGFNSVSAGQRVAPGQVVGAVGNTGRSTGPHLHFEVNERGIGVAAGRIDPAPLITGSSRQGGGGTIVTGVPGATVTEDTFVTPTRMETTSVDAAARLEEQLEADNPAEAGAFDLSQQYNQFRSMLGAGGGIPS